jgi:galactokinase
LQPIRVYGHSAPIKAGYPPAVGKLRAVAPGRVNLIGEHTDYNDGLVLPVAIGLHTWIDIAPRTDRMVQIELSATGEVGRFNLDDLPPPSGGWLDYVCGVAGELAAAGWPTAGFDGLLSSTLPMSAGLSSSAALELAAAWAFIGAHNGGTNGDALASMDRMALARLCQRAENGYVGVRSGLMDQFASSCGRAGCALLLDCRSLAYRPVRLPPDLQLVVVETGAERRLAASAYNERRAQCERGVAILRDRDGRIDALRDATVAMLDEARPELGDTIYRRLRHVVDENQRVEETVAALESGDRATLGALFAASHASLRDLYEVSSPALDAAVEIAVATPGVVAARMTGGGFGGCTVNLVEADAVAALQARIERDYPARTGLTPVVRAVEAVDGAGLVAR